jgi:large subunit ribosomal protein L15
MAKKRSEKFRGMRTHGHGRNARRGHGKRGGVGNAGSFTHRFIKIYKENPRYFGMHGFKRAPELIEKKRTINLSEIQDRIDTLIAQGYAKKEGEMYIIDLTSMGVDKLLGSGTVRMPMKIIVEEASENAIEKVKSAGGEVEVNA